MTTTLKREHIQTMIDRLTTFRPEREPVIYSHPIDAPFMEAMFNGNKDFDAVYRLWSECKRKYFMGAKRNISKWGLQPLVKQYSDRLDSLT
ncbi:MAG TPA: hypothetical protein VGQ12_07730 [Candidatus Angelobacter sp.]|jgi:hypothetical protein|nr:hypothetical protein [Candidatus Angelobacter sp.]